MTFPLGVNNIKKKSDQSYHSQLHIFHRVFLTVFPLKTPDEREYLTQTLEIWELFIRACQKKKKSVKSSALT